jgi:dTDP-4-dehydrorhamnose reductase
VKIILTGASGLFGTAMRDAVSGSDHVVTPVSRTPRCDAQGPWLTLQGDFESSCAALAPDAIVHAAALSSPAVCEQNSSDAYAANVLLTQRVVALARDLGVPCVFLSTDLVFDGNCDVPPGGFDERSDPRPQSVYAKTKLQAEEVALAYPSSCVLRISLLIGEGAVPLI